jgi:hypothetical protein
MTPTATDNASIHPDDVLAFRREAWRKLGWNAEWADFLAVSSINLHSAEKMLKQGATHDQVVQILAGTDAMGGDDSHFDWDGLSRLQS